MKKGIISIVAILLLLMLVGLTIRLSVFPVHEEATELPLGIDVPERPPVVPAGTTLLRSNDDMILPTRDFLADPDTYELSDDGIYVIGERTEAVTGEQYRIFYDTLDGSIVVSLRAEPLAVARLRAEEELVASTGLSEGQLCEANILVNTGRYISPTYAGRDLGLSFCEGSVALE